MINIFDFVVLEKIVLKECLMLHTASKYLTRLYDRKAIEKFPVQDEMRYVKRR